MNDGRLFLALIAVVLFHFFIVLGNLIAFFVLPWLQPWYVALPLCTFVFWISLVRGIECPLTRFENYLRNELGIQPIKGFIKHYFLSWFEKKKK